MKLKAILIIAAVLLIATGVVFAIGALDKKTTEPTDNIAGLSDNQKAEDSEAILSYKQPEPEIGSYSPEFVKQYVAENKNELEDSEAIPCFGENELLFENQGCFLLGVDAGSFMVLGFRTDFFEKMVKMYPEPLVRENEDYLYLVYDTEHNSRLFLFYSKEKTNGMILDGYPIVIKEKLSYEDFSKIQSGDSITKINNIDSIVSLYIKEFDMVPDAYYEENKENKIYFSSLHLLSDGILKIDYAREDNDYIAINVTYANDFILEGYNGKTCYEIFEEDYVD